MGSGGDETSGVMTEGTGKQTEEDKEDGFWKVPLPPECMYFVDSPDSKSFSYLLLAVERATVIAMDAEWKPVLHGSGRVGAGQVPHVSILQIACRLQRQGKGANDSSAESLSSGHTLKTLREPTPKSSKNFKQDQEQPQGQLYRESDAQVGAEDEAQSRDDERRGEDGDKRSEKGVQRSEEHVGHVATGKETKTYTEMIFLLDLLAIPAAAFSKLLKNVFVDPAVLKLGFGFKQDLLLLRGTFPGPDAHGCFDKVEPYLDVGKLYRHLHTNKSTFMSRGKRIMTGGEYSLTTISEKILGLPLSKDMQCSNWEQRPLTSGQFDYAVADAYCLLMIFDALQLEASESWFTPNGAGDVLWNRCKVEVAGLLAPEGGVVGIADNYALDGICQPKRGDATAMVKAALGEAGISGLRTDVADEPRFKSSVTVDKTLSIKALVHRFGEKLLVTEGQAVSSNRSRRKTRSRRNREAGKNRELQDEEEFQYVGPRPWDDAVGGDGIPKFLCDAMVEGLARQLRCVGIDAASPNSRQCEPRELVDLAEKEGRIILTRDVKLLRRKLVPRELAYRVKRQGKWDQLAEIIESFKLTISEDQLLTRCTKCNGRFIPKALTAKEAAAQGPWNQVIPDCVLKDVDEFWQCALCKHLYWQCNYGHCKTVHHSSKEMAPYSPAHLNNLLRSATQETHRPGWK